MGPNIASNREGEQILLGFGKAQETAIKGMLDRMGLKPEQAIEVACGAVAGAAMMKGPPPAFVKRYEGKPGWTPALIAMEWSFAMECLKGMSLTP